MMPPSATATHVPPHADGVADQKLPQQTRLMGTPMAVVTEAEAVEAIVASAEAGQGHWTVTANLDHLRRYHASALDRSLIDEADLVVADGMPVIWASRIAGESLPERVSGSSMIWSICEAAGARGQSVFLLGGEQNVASRAADVFRATYPGLEIAGTACPPPGFERSDRELALVQEQVVDAAPNIVFVALGFPKQDLLIQTLREFLPEASFLGVGISLSYATGDLSRPPAWICNLGLEWAYRLWQEPTPRLARRYLVDGLPFALRLMMSAAGHRTMRSNRERRDAWGPPAR